MHAGMIRHQARRTRAGTGGETGERFDRVQAASRARSGTGRRKKGAQTPDHHCWLLCCPQMFGNSRLALRNRRLPVISTGSAGRCVSSSLQPCWMPRRLPAESSGSNLGIGPLIMMPRRCGAYSKRVCWLVCVCVSKCVF